MKRNIKLKRPSAELYVLADDIDDIISCIQRTGVYDQYKIRCVVTVFTVIYFIVVCLSYNYNKPVLVNELISFATQYGGAQKKAVRGI